MSAIIVGVKLPHRMLKPMPPAFISFTNFMIGTHDGNTSLAAQGAATMMIILAAYAVSCSIYGFIIVFLGGDTRIMIPFMAATWILMWIFRPSEGFVRRVDEKLNAPKGDGGG